MGTSALTTSFVTLQWAPITLGNAIIDQSWPVVVLNALFSEALRVNLGLGHPDHWLFCGVAGAPIFAPNLTRSLSPEACDPTCGSETYGFVFMRRGYLSPTPQPKRVPHTARPRCSQLSPSARASFAGCLVRDTPPTHNQIHGG